MCGRGPATAPRRTRRRRTWPAGITFPSRGQRELLGQLGGVAVSSGWMAGIRGKTAALIGASGFAGRVRDLLAQAPAVHADETPARAGGGLRYVHLACTPYLALMHTGDRSAHTIDAGEVLPHLTGVLVRDGYVGYTHLDHVLARLVRRPPAARPARHPRSRLRRPVVGPRHGRHAPGGQPPRPRRPRHGTRGTQPGRTTHHPPALHRSTGPLPPGQPEQEHRTGPSCPHPGQTFRGTPRSDPPLHHRPSASPSPTTRQNATSDPRRYSNAPPEAAGEPYKGSPTSPSSSPTCRPRPSGASAATTHSSASSPPGHGSHTPSNQPDKHPQRPHLTASR